MITLTELAATEVKSIVARKQEASQQDGQDATPQYLRIGVKGGGCSGFSYTLDVTAEPDKDDEVFTSHDVRVVCDRKSYLYLNGTEVDFEADLLHGGFQFNNPNAKRSCGCGASFAT